MRSEFGLVGGDIKVSLALMPAKARYSVAIGHRPAFGRRDGSQAGDSSVEASQANIAWSADACGVKDGSDAA